MVLPQYSWGHSPTVHTKIYAFEGLVMYCIWYTAHKMYNPTYILSKNYMAHKWFLYVLSQRLFCTGSWRWCLSSGQSYSCCLHCELVSKQPVLPDWAEYLQSNDVLKTCPLRQKSAQPTKTDLITAVHPAHLPHFVIQWYFSSENH